MELLLQFVIVGRENSTKFGDPERKKWILFWSDRKYFYLNN